ncbi:MAG TPA: YqgE/AlgH family protein [Opitutae bacterium]|nr:YqgE/AlgH family protein [Opitutae bacterium]|tara:strand:+ start:17208 stop:17780 length:573 start_codon:yes stop_codon:yes gene_type:complete
MKGRLQLDSKKNSLAGVLLLASPKLLDPNFKRSIVLVSAHSSDEGAIGFVLNRPLGKTLGQLKPEFLYGSLAQVPVYQGGPVSQDKMIFVAWRWLDDERAFKLFFGLTEDKLLGVMAQEQDLSVRCYIGCSGWSQGQLEGELAQDAWVPTPVTKEAILSQGGEGLWRLMLGQTMPETLISGLVPKDPSLN